MTSVRRLRRLPADLLIGGGLLAAILVLCLVGSFFWAVDPIEGNLTAIFKPPMTVVGGQFHPFGTDQLGRDLLARIIRGTTISLSVVAVASVISTILGTALGIIAGYAGGLVDAIIMRLVDIQLAVPFILLILMIVAVLGPGPTNLILVLGVTGWAVFARVARARTLEVRELEYVEAARALGLSHPRILLKHIFPNVVTSQIVLITVDLPRLVMMEASVGFLGLGIQPPVPTLGNLIGEGQNYILVANWLVLFPGLVICALVVGFNLFGDWATWRTGMRVDQ